MSSTGNVNNTSSSSSSKYYNRVSGLGSGIDIESTITQIMNAESKPLDVLKQKQQTILWKESAYRTQNTLLSTVRDDLFSLKMESAYNTRMSTSSNQSVATATVTSSTPTGSYNLNVTQMATNATNSSNAPLTMAAAVTGNFITTATIDDTHNSFNISLNGVAQTITLAASAYGEYSYNPAGDQKPISDLVSAIQTQLAAATKSGANPNGFTTPVYVKATSDNELVFYTGPSDDGSNPTLVVNNASGNDILSGLGFTNNESSQGVTGSVLETDGTQPITIGSTNNKFKITLGSGATKEVTLSEGDYTMSQLAAEIQTEVQALGGDFAKVNVAATNYNQLRFDTTATTGSTLLGITLNSGASNDALQTIGFTDGVGSSSQTGLDITKSLYSQKDRFVNSDFFNSYDTSTNNSFGFSINGQSFDFTVNNSIDDIIDAINSNQAAGVTAFYDQFANKMVLTDNKAGNLNVNGADIQLSDPNNFLSQVLNLNAANEVSGKNAIVTVNGYQTQQQGNTFTLNNTTFNLIGTGSTTVSVSTDASTIATKVQKFITDYNAAVSSMNSAMSQSRAKDTNGNYYSPLTDSQKASMNDDQITKWENLAQQGLLQNDEILQSTMSGLRSDASRIVSPTTSQTGLTLSGTIDLTSANQFKVTLGSMTKTISLDQNSYSSSQYGQMTADLQNKLNAAFGAGAITVSLKNNKITMSTTNRVVTLNNGDTSNGLSKLGFSNGAAIKTTVSNLADLGITTAGAGTQDALAAATENGKLYFDQTKFTEALQANPDAVMNLLTASGLSTGSTTPDTAKQGIFTKLYSSVNNSMTQVSHQAGASDSDNDSTLNSLGTQVSDIEKQISAMNDKLDTEEERLWKQFNYMDTILGQMNTQSTMISNMLSSG